MARIYAALIRKGIKTLEDKICLNNTQLELKITEKGWKYVPQKK